jgi:hypothetical protein
MIAIAVNCFVTEARRKDVPGKIGLRSSKLTIPYPLLCTTLPSRITNTAAPGVPVPLTGRHQRIDSRRRVRATTQGGKRSRGDYGSSEHVSRVLS